MTSRWPSTFIWGLKAVTARLYGLSTMHNSSDVFTGTLDSGEKVVEAIF